MEKLKSVLRKTRPIGVDRLENSAEHSWQTTLAAVLFLEDAPDGLDHLKVLKMLLIHDVVEIDVGDVFVYDEQARQDVAMLEDAAAERVFGLLPSPLNAELLALWREFEARETPESRFAKALDRVCPVIQNLHAPVSSWREHGISRARVLAKNAEIGNANKNLWSMLQDEINAMDFQ